MEKLTTLAHQTILEDLEHLIQQVIDPKVSNPGCPNIFLDQPICSVYLSFFLSIWSIYLIYLPLQHTDFAVLSAIQIHVPGGITFIYPGEMYSVVDGVKETITLTCCAAHKNHGDKDNNNNNSNNKNMRKSNSKGE